MSRVKYPRLFAVIDTAYGESDGNTAFNLPDLRGRVPLRRDKHKVRTTDAAQMGDAGGQDMHTITVGELPSHRHNRESLTVNANGAHTHGIYDPTHSHAEVFVIMGAHLVFLIIKQSQASLATIVI